MPSPITPAQAKMLRKLGEKVKAIREARGLTQEQVAYQIQKDRQSIARLEAGKVNPSFLYLTEICKGLDIPIAELLQND